VLDLFGQSYHWSLMQVEFASDVVLCSKASLQPLYEQLSRQAILTVKAEHVATFLGHKITAQLAQEVGSRFAPPPRTDPVASPATARLQHRRHSPRRSSGVPRPNLARKPLQTAQTPASSRPD
jgi:hypothetical protein